MSAPSSRNRLTCLACLSVMLAATGVCFGQAQGYPAIDRPSKDVVLAFDRSGRIGKVLVKDGDVVKAGDVLARLDDVAETLELARLKAEAEKKMSIEAAEAQLKQAKNDLARTKLAAKGGAATDLEVQHDELEVTIAELRLQVARFDQAQAVREYEKAKAQVDRMKLRAPFDGKVEEVFLSEGESADAHAKVIRLVKIDPLWIDVALPEIQAEALKVGQQATVTCSTGGKSVLGKVVFKSAVGDPGSGTLTVRVEAPNRQMAAAGKHVRVNFTVKKETAESDTESTKASDAKDSANKGAEDKKG